MQLDLTVPSPSRRLAQLKRFAVENSILLVFVAMFLVSMALVPNFLTLFNLKNLLLQTVDIAIVAMGVTFVVLNGGIDFSAASVLALSSVFGAYIMVYSPLAETPWSIPVAIMVMVGLGALIGVFNGFSVTVLKIPSFIATLATSMVATGGAIWFTSIVAEKASIYGMPDAFFLLGGDQGFIIIPLAILAVVYVFTYWLLKYTLFGRQVYAVGTNPRAAFISGVPVKATIFKIMLLSGIFAGIQGVILTARNQAGLPNLGDKVFIDIVVSIVIGGASVFGGAGGVKQTLYSVLFITLMNNIVNLLGVDWYIISLVKGVLVLGAAFIDIFTRRMELQRKW